MEMGVRASGIPVPQSVSLQYAVETPPLPAKDLALMIRADTTAPVFNDKETRARATTQVDKVARGGYSIDVGTFGILGRV